MAKLRIRNQQKTVEEIGLAIARLRDTRIALYREVVWNLFTHILRQSPQFSGALVAHWTIGIDSPATFYDPSLGSDNLRSRRLAGELRPLQRGSQYWMRVARDRERPKLQRIRRGSTVFITNGVLGDTDNGKSAENYAASLQDPAYWQTKLRAVNQPYIVTEESALVIATQYWNKKIDPFTWAGASGIANESE